MKIIAVDDEELQLETILEYLQELYPHAEIRGFTRVSDALTHLDGSMPDVAILDINMPGNINGISLGEILRKKNKRIKLLYCTGYAEYAMDAYKMHANGYLRKPVQKEELKKEMQYVLQMPVYDDERPHIHAFGNFDVYVDNRPVEFKRKKSKEILAYLVDREGSWVTNKELIVILWDGSDVSDGAFSKYITLLVNLMMADLESAGVAYVVERQRGRLRLLKDRVACDYYGYLNNEEEAILKFHGEYMSQYSWGEETLAALLASRSVKFKINENKETV